MLGTLFLIILGVPYINSLTIDEYESIRVAVLTRLQYSDKEDNVRLHPTMVRLSRKIQLIHLS